MRPIRFLNVLLAFALVAVVCLLITGCSMFSGSSGSDSSAKLQTVSKTIAQAVVLAYQSGGNELAYQQIDKAVADGKITPEQAAQLKAAADKGIAALQEIANAPAAQAAATSAPSTAPPVQ